MAESNGVAEMVPATQPYPRSLAQGAGVLPASAAASAGAHDWYLYGLAAIIVLGFFGLTITMVLREIPQGSQNIAYMLLGGLVTGFSMVLSYFFGSSAGSASKMTQITELMKQAPPKG